jgi:hypothetical protein
MGSAVPRPASTRLQSTTNAERTFGNGNASQELPQPPMLIRMEWLVRLNQLRSALTAAAKPAATVLNVIVASALLVALVRLLLGTAYLPGIPEFAGPWVWFAVLASLGLVIGHWWIVPLPLILQPLTEQYMVFTGALRWYAFEWPFTALVLLLAVASVGFGVVVRYLLNRVAGGAAWPGLVTSLVMMLLTASQPALVWTAFLDPRPIATLGPPPLLSAAELHARATGAPYPVYAASETFGSPAAAMRSVSSGPAGTVVSDIFYVVYHGEDRHGLDDIDVMTSPRDVGQPDRIVFEKNGPDGEIRVTREPVGLPTGTIEMDGRTWEVSPLPSNGRFVATTDIGDVRVSISTRDRASFDRVVPDLRQID